MLRRALFSAKDLSTADIAKAVLLTHLTYRPTYNSAELLSEGDGGWAGGSQFGPQYCSGISYEHVILCFNGGFD